MEDSPKWNWKGGLRVEEGGRVEVQNERRRERDEDEDL
jgi:hypothetical protein